MSGRTAALAVAAASITIYWAALSCGFAGDDFMILHRLREAGGLSGAFRFFRGEFFEYYRPLPFLLHAVDWRMAGANAAQFHLTNALLHALNSVLVVLIARALAPRTPAGLISGLLFALHPSNHEAVVWISARFDLLATFFSLAAIYWMMRAPNGSSWLSPLFFLGAVLSKEAAVALPIAAAGFMVFTLRAKTITAARQVAPWLAALVVYGALRRIAGGVSAIGGTTRLPKLLLFGVLLAAVLLLGDGRWLRLRAFLRDRAGLAIGVLGAIAAAVAVAAASGGSIGRLCAEKLAVTGFALFHLGSPVLDVFTIPFYLDPGTRQYWLGGAIAIAIALIIVALIWRAALDDDRSWFLAAFLIAALLPISALTEGARYLYLPSAAVCVFAGIRIADLQPRARAVAVPLLAVFLAVSAVQVLLKVRDWQWAGRMIADGARLVDSSLAPACGEGRVVFLTEPVAVRGVYTHFLYETFELPRGCMPAEFENLIRVMRLDTTVNVRWDGPSRLVMIAPHYRGNFSLSSDLRNFDPPLGRSTSSRRQTPLGELTARPVDDGEELTLTLAPSIDRSHIHWFYYSDGAVHPFPQ